MKLSEIKGEQAIEVIADLIEPITNIATDKNCADAFNATQKEGETKEETAARHIKEKIPYLMKAHKKDVAKIVGILEGKDPEELNILQIFTAVIELLNDKALMQLFSSAVLTEEADPPVEVSKK